MDLFNHLVGEQLKTMDKLLFLQSEIERCQEVEAQLQLLSNETDLRSVQLEIEQMKKELSDIQQTFEQQTEDVIRSYQEENVLA